MTTTNFFGPLFYRSSLSIKCDLNSIASIPCLFLTCRPLTIFFTIISIIINPFYCCVRSSMGIKMFDVGLIHVLQKLIKRHPQTPYTTPPIPWVSRIIDFITNIVHSPPSIFQGKMHGVNFSFTHQISLIVPT